jgi:hypothetical protein
VQRRATGFAVPAESVDTAETMEAHNGCRRNRPTWETVTGLSKGKGLHRRQTAGALRKGMGGRDPKGPPMTVKGNSPGAKVEDGTGLKVVRRQATVCQGIQAGLASKPLGKRSGVSKAGDESPA